MASFGAIGESAIGETPEEKDGVAKRDLGTLTAQVNPSGLSDVPTAEDQIGFKPYVRAVAWFLSNERTKPPLTMSIEGPWGSGKSSFMLQLRHELELQNTQVAKNHYVSFNAWRSDKEEALWAAFALTFIKQLAPTIAISNRLKGNLGLLWRRIDWTKGWFQLLQFGLSWGAVIAISIWVYTHPELIASPDLKTAAVSLPWLAAAYLGYEKSKTIFGNPLTHDISSYTRNLKYEDKVAFIDRFQDDFSDIVKSYVGSDGRVFIFIDDLDRCEVPRAADLLQAINLLLSADQGNMFFILGLDREMVAAGIAAKNEKILPYIAAGRSVQSQDKPDLFRIGIEYGYGFMEKFIQVPFKVPRPDEREIANWVTRLTSADDVVAGDLSSDPVEQQPRPLTGATPSGLDIRSGADPDGFEAVVERMAEVFEFNPRRLKQFVNVFRLRVMIALSTGVLMPARPVTSSFAKSEGISIQQLGLFTAILMRWSALAVDLVETPRLLDELVQFEITPPSKLSRMAVKWGADAKLRRMIQLDATYSLFTVDLRPLLMIMPDAYSGTLARREPWQTRTTLIAGFGGDDRPGTPTGLESFSGSPDGPSAAA